VSAAVLPASVKAEVKLTTLGGVSVAARELAALDVPEGRGLGLLAVFFAGGDDDGRWLLVDAAAWRGRAGASVSAARSVLAALARGQPRLGALRRHVDEAWPRFLVAFADAVEAGHAALVTALEEAHARGDVEAFLPRDPVLAYERRAAVRALLERHGEADAGRLAQDLLAYVLAQAGWRKVTLNPVGVPDFVLEEPAHGEPQPGDVTLTLPREEAERVVALFRAAGEQALARELELSLRQARGQRTG
jgi:hypothetical protein